jgi:stage V sporulation protein D (sporulation-specific penicillin-binding protein)
MQVLGRTSDLHCWKSAGHGSQTLTQAVQHSCNVAFVNIGLKVGAAKFYDYVRAFGLFETTGIDIAGESGSIWWSTDEFCDSQNLSQLAAASFGQTFNVTPLQMITAVSAAINGGYLMEPYIVDKITDSDGNIIEAHEPTVVRQVISEETSQKVCEILEKVVGDPVDGTGKNAYVMGYRIGGKTGTSEKVANEAATGTKEYIVSFLGFAPADDPQIAILVLLDTPSSSTGIYISGGVMAAPTVGNMLADILPYMGVEPEYTDEELQDIDRTVPFVKQKSVEDAKAALEDEGFDVQVVGSGDTVTDQLPAANATVASGTKVIIYAGEEKPDTVVTVPDLTGMTLSQAKSALENKGLYLSTNGYVSSSSSTSVSKQSYSAGEEVTYGTVVSVTLVDKSNQGRY